MHRWLCETFILSGASVAIVLAVLVAATAMAYPAPEIDSPEWWPVSDCYTARLVALASSSVDGSALLCTADDAVRPAIYVSGLTPGRTYGAVILPFERWPECGSSPCTGEALFESDHPRIFGHLGDAPARSDGTAHFRGHFDGWSLASGADVTLLVTSQSTGDASVNGASMRQFFGPLRPRLGGGSTASVVALTTFRLP